MAPSTRLAIGRIPMNATDQRAITRPRSWSSMWRYISADDRVWEAR